MNYRRHVLLSITLITTLLGCTPPPPVTQHGSASNLAARYAGLDSGSLYKLNPANSTIRIYVFRGGSFPRLGHNHVLSAPQFTGYAHIPASGIKDARVDLEFRLDQLEIDNPAIRATLGSAYTSTMNTEAIAGTRTHMLGEENMQAERFPYVRIGSMHIVGEAPGLAATVSVEMHGHQREMQLPLSVEGLPEQLAVSGTLILRQSDFGIKPYSVAGGLLAVQDEVVVEFKLVGPRTGKPSENKT